MLHLLLFSLALADEGAESEPEEQEPPPAEPAPAPAPTGGRAPTVRAPPPAERSSFGSLRWMSLKDSPESARSLAAAFGGAYGAYAGGATAYSAFGEDAEWIVPGALLGAGAGAVVGMTATKSGNVSVHQVVYTGSTTTYGGFLGYEVARFFIPPGAAEESRRIQAAGVLGSIAGLGVGMLARDPPDGEVMLRADLGMGAGFLMGTAINSLSGLDLHDDRQRRVPITVTSTTVLGGLALGAAASNLDQPGPNSMALGLAQGGWIGLWTPTLLGAEPGAQRGWAGARLGMGAGYLASYGVAAFGEPDGRSLVLQGVGMGLGNALGAGVPLLLDGEHAAPRPVVGSMLVGSVAGQVAGALAAPRLTLSDDDVALLGALGAWSAWQSAGWGVYTGIRSDDGVKGFGAGFTLAGLTGLGGLALTQAAEASPQGSTLLLSAGAWGSGLSALTGVAMGLEPQQGLALSLGTGDLALLGTGAALAAGADPSWGTVARVNGGLAVGGSLGALGTLIFAYDEGNTARQAAATVVGSGLGLAGALLIPQRAPREKTASRLLPAPHLDLPIHAGWSVAPWTAPDGAQGAWLSVQGVIDNPT